MTYIYYVYITRLSSPLSSSTHIEWWKRAVSSEIQKNTRKQFGNFLIRYKYLVIKSVIKHRPSFFNKFGTSVNHHGILYHFFLLVNLNNISVFTLDILLSCIRLQIKFTLIWEDNCRQLFMDALIVMLTPLFRDQKYI